jgi:hypothetical protein
MGIFIHVSYFLQQFYDEVLSATVSQKLWTITGSKGCSRGSATVTGSREVTLAVSRGDSVTGAAATAAGAAAAGGADRNIDCCLIMDDKKNNKITAVTISEDACGKKRHFVEVDSDSKKK